LEAAKKHDYQNKKNKIDEVRILTNQMKKKGKKTKKLKGKQTYPKQPK
jgi:hypothetical protein